MAKESVSNVIELQIPLTAQQEKFAIAVANGSTPTSAYREAYPSAGGNITGRAKQLLANPEVNERVLSLRDQFAGEKMTLASHLADLKTLRDKAVALGMIGSAIMAEVARGKASGVAVDKQEITHKLKALPSSVDDFL